MTVAEADLEGGDHGHRARPARELRRFAIRAFAAVLVALVAVVGLAGRYLPAGEGRPNHVELLRPVIQPWLQFDAGWYTWIAEDGYSDEQVARYDRHDESAAAFFPGYPLLARLVAPVFGETLVGEVALTIFFGAASAVLLASWCRRRLGDRASRFTVLALFLFPYAYYLVAAPYADAMFLAATLAAFLLVEDDHPVLGGLAGAVATATRPVGIAVIVGLAVVVLTRRDALRWRPRPSVLWARLRARDAGVLLSAAGVGSFMAFSWYRFGSPIAYSIAQRGWNQALDVETVLKLHFFDRLLHDANHGYVLRLALQGVLALIFLAAVPQVWRRFGAAYGIYTLVVLGLPTLGSGMFISVGRYLLAAFPVFALAGAWLAERTPHQARALVVASGLGLALFASFYGRGYFMA